MRIRKILATAMAGLCAGASATAVEPEGRYARGWAELQKIDGEAGEKVIASLKEVSPDLGRLIIEHAFGDIYARGGLSLQKKELAVVAALTAMGTAAPQLEVHIKGALNVGLDAGAVAEAILQMSAYAGFPAAINGMGALKTVLGARKMTGKAEAILMSPDERRLRGEKVMEAVAPGQAAALHARFDAVSPDLARYVVEFGYGEILSRPGLTLEMREIATVAALTALGTAPTQLRFHIAAALHAGVSAVEIREIMLLMSVYAGFPAAINGTLALKDVLAAETHHGRGQ